jgi:uncharacterized protein (DUF433 family)
LLAQLLQPLLEELGFEVKATPILRSLDQGKQFLLLRRIVLDPEVMVGKPVIRGTRLTVDYVLNLLAHMATVTEVLQEYEGVAQEDIPACLLFATKSLQETVFLPLVAEAV